MDRRPEAEAEAEEEKKIEEFYALIRNVRDARNELKELSAMRRAHSNNNNNNKSIHENNNKSKKRKAAEGDQDRRSAPWVPAFEWQDFCTGEEGVVDPLPVAEFTRKTLTTQHHHQQHRMIKNDINTSSHQRDEDCGLDLKLTL